MNIASMFSQLAEGFWVTVQIFVLTLVFSMPLGLYRVLWQNVKMQSASAACESIYFHYERNTV